MGHPVVHFEIGCKDKEKTIQFYKDLFDWEIETCDTACMVNTGSESGIAGHITALGHEPHNYVNIYVQVPSLEATVERVESLGGKTIIPPTDVPGMGRFSWISDVEGTTIGLWEPK